MAYLAVIATVCLSLYPHGHHYSQISPPAHTAYNDTDDIVYKQLDVATTVLTDDSRAGKHLFLIVSYFTFELAINN